MQDNVEKTCKIVIAGPDQAGKVLNSIIETSLRKRMAEGIFYKQVLATMGIDLGIKRLIIDNQSVKMYILDPYTKERCKDANGVILTFDICEENSFQKMQKFHEQSLQEITSMNADISLLLVGCKSDLENKRQVSYDIAFAFAQNHGMHYIETSAYLGTNCQEVAEYLAKDILAQMKKHEAKLLQVETKEKGSQFEKQGTCQCQ